MKKIVCLAAALIVGVSASWANESIASKGSPAAQAAGARAAAADFTLMGVDQQKHTLSASRGKEPVMLFFWTTWCPYCRKALKTVKESQQELQEANLRVYAINVGENPDKVAAFVRDGGYEFAILFDQDSSVAQEYGLIGVPTYLLIGRDGTILFKGNYYPKGKFKQLLGA